MNYGVKITKTNWHAEIQASLDARGIAWSRKRADDGRMLYLIGGEMLTPGEARDLGAGISRPPAETGACHCWRAVIHVGMHDGHCCFREDMPCHEDPRPALAHQSAT